MANMMTVHENPNGQTNGTRFPMEKTIACYYRDYYYNIERLFDVKIITADVSFVERIIL